MVPSANEEIAASPSSWRLCEQIVTSVSFVAIFYPKGGGLVEEPAPQGFTNGEPLAVGLVGVGCRNGETIDGVDNAARVRINI